MEKQLESNLTREMYGYYISQTDPFHDKPWRLDGAPSSLNSQSLVYTYKSELVVNAASFGLPVTPGSKFDLHAVLFPISTPIQVNGVQNNLPGNYRNGTFAFVNNLNFFPLTLCGVASGGETYSWTAGVTPALQYIGVPNDYPINLLQAGTGGGFAGRPFREIGRAYQILDQTPKLYQQGSITNYSTPSMDVERQTTFSPIANTSSTVVTNNRTATLLSMPPTSLVQATRIPNQQTWDCSKGAYCVARKNVEEIPFSAVTCQPVVFSGFPDATAVAAGTTYKSFVSKSATTQSALVSSEATSVCPYNLYGSYIGGASSEFGTFRIRLVQFFEVLPIASDTDIVSLMTPTLPRDPEGELLIQKILSDLPTFVPQTDNPKGEAWRKVLKTTGKYITLLSPALGGLNAPLGEAAVNVGKAVTSISEVGKKGPKRGPKSQPKTKADSNAGSAGK